MRLLSNAIFALILLTLSSNGQVVPKQDSERSSKELLSSKHISRDAGKQGQKIALVEIEDIWTLYDPIEKYSRPLYKDEFETTNQFETRIREHANATFYRGKSINESFMISLRGADSKYDADSKKMRFFARVNKIDPEYKRSGFGFAASNLYSIDIVKYFIVREKAIQVTYSLQFNEFSDFWNGRNEAHGFSIEMVLEADNAKRLKADTDAVAVVKFKKPYVKEDNSFLRYLQIELLDLYFVDRGTGKVLGKLSETRKR